MGNAGADPGDTHYPIFKLNLWFAVSSILLLGCVGWMIYHDWNREWKQWQREFQHQEGVRVEKELAKFESKESIEELTKLGNAINDAKKSLESKKKEIEAAQEVVIQARAERYNADQAQRVAKADLDWQKYLVEEHRIHHPGEPLARQSEINAGIEKVAAAKARFEKAEKEYAEAEGKLKAIKAGQLKADADMAAATLQRDFLARKLEELKPRTLEGKAAKGIRDAPMLDFAAPSLKVDKVVLDDLFFDLKFPGAKKKRVDMCMTCHVPIDKIDKVYTEGENPLKSHPRLDLFLTDSSPHPMKKVGCTVCHSGSGETLTFIHADHTPRDEKQRKEWEEKYNWEKMHHWEYPMLPAQFTESSCYQCHSKHVDVIKADAPKLFKAVQLVEKAGCYGCHKIQQGEWLNIRKAGPSLTKIASKVDADWAYNWVQKPTDFRPSTWMPQIFHLSNATDPTRKDLKVVEREDVAVNAILEYLWDQSEKTQIPAPPVKGDAARGKESIQLVGCLACHQVDGVNEANEWNDFGPNLSGVGSKLSEAWLYQWVKDPKKYFPETRMPDLRLSDQEAADIAAYLHSLKKEGWNPKRPPVDEKLLNQIAAEYLDAQLNKTADDEKLLEAAKKGIADKRNLMLYVGRKFIARQGCFGCHEIKGFEKETPIGTELTEWGSKDLDKLDFGNFLVQGNADRIEKTRHAWAQTKLTDPRTFDKGKIKQPDDLLKMPQFRFTKEEVETVTTLLLGLMRSDIPQQSMPKFSPAKETLAEGSFMIRRNNCEACHVFQYEKVTFKHPVDGITSIRGPLTNDEDDEELCMVGLRETAPSFSAEERCEVGKTVSLKKADILSVGPRMGGGLFKSLENQAKQAYVLLDAKGERQTSVKTGVELEPYAPPSLVGEGRKVQSDWLYDFLKKPTTIRPQVRVKMPTFGFSDREASTISQWFIRREEERFPGEFTRAFRMKQKWTRPQLAKAINLGGDANELLERLESGQRIGGDAFQRIQRLAQSMNFTMDPMPGIPFDMMSEQAADYLDHPGKRDAANCGSNLVNQPSEQGGGACYTCHWKEGKPQTADPFTWAPDLKKVQRRLRGDWLRQWLLDPSQIIPSTKMPKPGITGDLSGKWCPNTGFAERVESIKDYLMNYDRIHSAADINQR